MIGLQTSPEPPPPPLNRRPIILYIHTFICPNAVDLRFFLHFALFNAIFRLISNAFLLYFQKLIHTSTRFLHSIKFAEKTIKHIHPKLSVPPPRNPLRHRHNQTRIFLRISAKFCIHFRGSPFFFSEIKILMAHWKRENARNLAFSTFHFFISREPFELRKISDRIKSTFSPQLPVRMHFSFFPAFIRQLHAAEVTTPAERVGHIYLYDLILYVLNKVFGSGFKFIS